MNKIKSEILFNRGLLWLALAYVRALHQDTNSKIAPFVFLVVAAYNFYRALKTEAEGE